MAFPERHACCRCPSTDSLHIYDSPEFSEAAEAVKPRSHVCQTQRRVLKGSKPAAPRQV